MRIVFMGTPEFAATSLRRIAHEHEVVLVVTRPDAVRSRGKALEPSPVKDVALELGLDCVEAKRVEAPLIEQIRSTAPDVIVVAAYGCILPDELLEIEGVPCVNIHASLLPRWRGAAPVQRAILAGDELTGVSLMQVVHELDAGAYCAQAELEIGDKNCDELLRELAELGAELLLAHLDDIVAGRAKWQEQDESQVCFAPKLEKTEVFLDPVCSAAENLRRVRAQSDTAPCRVRLGERNARVLEAKLLGECPELAAGELYVMKSRLALMCADGALEILSLRPDGKRDMSASAFVQGLGGARSWESLA